jgi:hypothetical protein
VHATRLTTYSRGMLRKRQPPSSLSLFMSTPSRCAPPSNLMPPPPHTHPHLCFLFFPLPTTQSCSYRWRSATPLFAPRLIHCCCLYSSLFASLTFSLQPHGRLARLFGASSGARHHTGWTCCNFALPSLPPLLPCGAVKREHPFFSFRAFGVKGLGSGDTVGTLLSFGVCVCLFVFVLLSWPTYLQKRVLLLLFSFGSLVAAP